MRQVFWCVSWGLLCRSVPSTPILGLQVELSFFDADAYLRTAVVSGLRVGVCVVVFFPSCFVKVRVSFRVSAKRIADGVFGRSRDSFLGWNQSKGCCTCRALLVRVKPSAREERPTKWQRRGRTFFALFLVSSRSQGVKGHLLCCKRVRNVEVVLFRF